MWPDLGCQIRTQSKRLLTHLVCTVTTCTHQPAPSRTFLPVARQVSLVSYPAMTSSSTIVFRFNVVRRLRYGRTLMQTYWEEDMHILTSCRITQSGTHCNLLCIPVSCISSCLHQGFKQLASLHRSVLGFTSVCEPVTVVGLQPI